MLSTNLLLAERGAGLAFRVAVVLMLLFGLPPVATADVAGVGDEEVDLASASEMNLQVLELYREGRFAEALPMAKAVLAIQERVHGSLHLGTAAALNNLAAVLQGLGDLSQALTHMERALAIREDLLGPDHLTTALCLNNLGNLLREMGDYRRARDCLERAIPVLRELLGDEHSQTAVSLQILGGVLMEMGDLSGALECLELSLAIREEVLGAMHPDTAQALNNLGLLYMEAGDFVRARTCLERALAINEIVLGPEDPVTATTLGNLGSLLLSVGDHALAKVYSERSLAIKEDATVSSKLDIAVDLNNLGVLNQRMGDHKGALRCFERALDIQQDELGPDHLSTAMTLNNLAFLLQQRGNLREALSLYQQALATKVKILGVEHPNTAIGYNNVGFLLHEIGDLAGAQIQYERALAIKEKLLGAEHPDTASVLVNLGFLSWRLGDVDLARQRLSAAFHATEKVVETLLSATSERERIQMVAARREDLDFLLSLFDRPDDGETTHSAVLRWKGVVGETLLAQRAVGLSGSEPELAEKLASLAETRQRLATAVFFVPTTGDERDRRFARVKELTLKKERLERELARESSPFQRELTVTAAASNDICAQLPAGTALVDYLRYDRVQVEKGKGNLTWTYSYVAFVLLSGSCGMPFRVELGPADPIEEAVSHHRQLLDSSSTHRTVSVARLNSTARRIRKLVWDPVVSHFGGRTNVLIVPDAALAGVPFGALVDDEDKYLIESYDLSLLSTGQQLIRLASQEGSTADGALVVGGIDYDGLEPGTTEPAVAGSSKAAPTRGSGLFPVASLAASGPEASAVAHSLGAGVLLLTGKEATESRIKQCAPGKRTVHLATHGFFATGKARSTLEGSEITNSRGVRMLGGLNSRQVIGFNPMVLSGVILAGANARAAGEVTRGDDDGVLTAEEVASLDLRGAELVVLSACETGLGEVKSGEGVLGLRRAFAFAGARALVMSLWKVPDQETMELMQSFYARVKAEPDVDKGEAMRAAQLELIQHLRQRDGIADPRLWAAWVVSGR